VLEQSIVCWMSTDSMFGFPKNLGSISKMRFCSIEVRNDCQHNDYHNKDTQHNNKELKHNKWRQAWQHSASRLVMVSVVFFIMLVSLCRVSLMVTVMFYIMLSVILLSVVLPSVLAPIKRCHCVLAYSTSLIPFLIDLVIIYWSKGF